ncbi:MAG: YeiH family protein, partial [Muribaculaceae bacterium]|nr:YeiH family protein [Muribaculaceae bacterium]
MNWIKKKSLGIILCIAIAGLSSFLATINIGSFSLEIIGAPVFAIVIGMIISLATPEFSANKKLKDGIKFTSKKILQWAVIILGFSL